MLQEAWAQVWKLAPKIATHKERFFENCVLARFTELR
jgi:hypothetical protein